METKKQISINGIPLVIYLCIIAIIIVGAYMGVIPDNMGGAYAICLVLGVFLMWIGNKTPVLKDYGFGTILCVLGPAILLYIGVLPKSLGPIAKNFFSVYDFTSFMVPALLVGSILAMDRKVLVNAGARFIVPMILTVFFATLISGLIGAISGYGMVNTMLYIAGPILGSGISASAVPLSEIYASYGGGNADTILVTLTSAIMVANILTIIFGALLAALGRKNPNMFFKGFAGTGGRLLRNEAKAIKITEDQKHEVVKDSNTTTFSALQMGFLLTSGIFIGGKILAKVIPGGLNFYLYMILISIILKLTDVLPAKLNDAAGEWQNFMAKIMVPVTLCAISLGVLKLEEVIKVFSNPSFLILSILCVAVTVLVSGFLTYLFGFYFVEGAIMAGLGLADMGGTGDVAVLAAADRMELLPFLTICSRIGGAINMVWLTFLASRLLGGA